MNRLNDSPMWAISPCGESKNLYVILPLWLPSLFCSFLNGGKLVNRKLETFFFVNSFVDFFRNLVNMTTFVYVSFA